MREPRSWMWIIEKRKLDAKASVPVSDEQVEEAVARRREEIKKKQLFEKEVFDLKFRTFMIASKAKSN